MQIKFLTVALATALTATLTGCGSDGDSNYNKQDVAPINFGDADSTEVKKLQTNVDELTNKLATSKKESAETVKKLEDRLQEALEAINKLKEDKGSPSTGGNTPETVPGEDRQPETEQPTNTEGSNPTNPEGSNPTNPEGGNPTNPEGGNPTNTDTAQPTKPVVKDPVHNVNNAAHEGSIDDKEVVVVQNYVRGASAVYDRVPNPTASNSANASVIGYNTLDNPAMSNIVLARPEIDSSKKTIFVGASAQEAKGFNFNTNGRLDLGEGKATSLQQHNISDVVELKDANTLKLLDNAGSLEGAANQQDKMGLDDFSKQAYRKGLVRTFSVGAANQTANEFLGEKGKADNAERFIVRGQEEQVIKIKDGKVVVLHETGFDNAEKDDDADPSVKRGVRMFGSLYHANGTKIGEKNDKNGDVPKYIFKNNKFEVNSSYNPDSTTPNSWMFDATSANASKKAAQTDASKLSANITPKVLHLNHVQYGRVTIDATQDNVDSILEELKDGKSLVSFGVAKPFKYTDNMALSANNKDFTQVNTYFARGNWATKPNEMPSEGKVTYLGHALAYGLDNSLHKGHNLDSNTVTLPKRQGIGNFVRAEADFATSKVTGSIYNVWTPDLDSIGQDAFEDTLVTFEGDITKGRNSVVGTSKLAYDSQEEGAFKGAFYGPKADEFAGSVNSVTKGYGPAKWGAVFGTQAQRPADPKTGISASTEAFAGQ